MAPGPIAKTLLPGDSPELQERLDTIAEKTVATGVGIEMASRAASDYYRKTGRMTEAIAVLQKHVEIQPAALHRRDGLAHWVEAAAEQLLVLAPELADRFVVRVGVGSQVRTATFSQVSVLMRRLEKVPVA